jgi:hypothetical protein
MLFLIAISIFVRPACVARVAPALSRRRMK